MKLLFINTSNCYSLTRPTHSATRVHALSCRLLGLYELSYRAFSYSTTCYGQQQPPFLFSVIPNTK